MISDNALYTLAILLGSISMLLIVFYHFLEINSTIDPEDVKTGTSKTRATPLSSERKADAVPAARIAEEKLGR